jgi:hypothetical protein
MKDYEFKLKAWIPFVKEKDFRRVIPQKKV